MGAKSSKLSVVVCTPNERKRRTYKLADEYQHNETSYYIFKPKITKLSASNTFIKLKLLYGDKLLDKFTVSLRSDGKGYSMKGKETIYKYSTTKDRSKIIVNVKGKYIETVTYQKEDTLQFNINGQVV